MTVDVDDSEGKVVSTVREGVCDGEVVNRIVKEFKHMIIPSGNNASRVPRHQHKV
jgi:hypothetical protein